jgi:hypothetical protein
MSPNRFRTKSILIALVSAVALILNVSASLAQSKCSTTLECAQQAVDAAAKADAAVEALQDRLAKLEALETSLGNGRILAMIQIKNGQLQSVSSPNVSFDQTTGLVSFPNPRNLAFLPVVSDANDAPYITSMHWIRAILPPDKFIVRAKAMDTGDRTYPPNNFAAVVVGFEAPPKP